MWFKIANQFSLLFVFVSFCWSQEAFETTEKSVRPKSITDQFLHRLTQNESPFHENPAVLITISKTQSKLSAGRYPHHISRLSQQNEDGRLAEIQEYDLPAGGYERWQIVRPIKKIGVVGLDLAFEHFGSYSRMNNDGQAISAFRRSNHAFGLRYAKRIIPNLAFGVDAKWLRSKESSIGEDNYIGHLGHGYAYNIGFLQTINAQIDFGLMIGNLSNGLSFQNSTVPSRLETRVLIGGRYIINLEPIFLGIEMAHQPRFDLGLQFDLTGKIAYQDQILLRLGYLHWSEKQQRLVRYLADGQTQNDQQIWQMKGLKLSLTWNIWQTQLTVNYQPYFRIKTDLFHKSTVQKGKSFLTFSVQF